MAARLFLFALACALAVASAAPTEKTVSVTEVTIPAERGAVKEVFIPVDAAKEGPVSLEIDLQPIVQNHGLFKYLPWNRLATPSAVDVNVNIEKEVKMEALEVRVNSALTTTTIHIDGSRLFGANNATEYVQTLASAVLFSTPRCCAASSPRSRLLYGLCSSSCCMCRCTPVGMHRGPHDIECRVPLSNRRGTEDFVLSASTQPTALAIFLLTALPIVCIVGSVLCAVMLFQTTADKGYVLNVQRCVRIGDGAHAVADPFVAERPLPAFSLLLRCTRIAQFLLRHDSRSPHSRLCPCVDTVFATTSISLTAMHPHLALASCREAYYPDEPAPAYSELVHIAKAVKIAEAERQSRLAQLEREREAALEEELPSYQESIERAHTAHASPISVVPPLVRDV